MITIATVAYVAGALIGLYFNIRVVISAALVSLYVCFALTVMGSFDPMETVFCAVLTIVMMQIGYISALVFDAYGLPGTKVTLIPVRVSSPSASDNPLHR